MAAAIADHYAVSVLLAVSAAEAKISGRIVVTDLRSALDVLGFFVGTRYRTDDAGRVFYFGGKEEKVLASLPSWGLSDTELRGVLGSSASVVGDRVVVETEQGRLTQLRETLEEFKERPSLTLEVFVVDIAKNSVDRVNERLDQVRIGGGYLAKSALVCATGSLGAAAGVGSIQRVAGPVYDVEVRGLFELLELDRTARVELRQQAQILSGSMTRFSSGEVQERELITREPETGKDLVSRIERRTIGLTLSLRAMAFPGGWHVKFVIEDRNRVTGSERTTNFEGERQLRGEDSGFFLLATFNRQADARIRRGLPLFQRLPRAMGRAFRQSETDHQSRSVMILGRRISK